ncbi:PfkB family carbohydrate kinase [Streptomyces sp. MnatMP-M17]|uniref:PfkB family carbohydrate kinase n=1 Tax=unclassified Streptomyces TaxID=2593676 RepID=UPI001F3D6185|nr:PfkB family carbohydrate kinase [Streptomyces sp. MnatMP-M17]
MALARRRSAGRVDDVTRRQGGEPGVARPARTPGRPPGARRARPRSGPRPGPPRLTRVDTTGAGDVFAGVTAAHLAHGTSLVEAAQQATLAAAQAIRRPRSSR